MTARGIISRLRRARRGAVIVEFTVSAVIVIMLLLMTLEFGVEVFMRQSIERGISAATAEYARHHDPGLAQDAATSQVPATFQSCIQPLAITLYNATSSLDGGGRAATGGPSDAGASLARVRLTCKWSRITPVARALLGADLVYSGAALARLR